VRNATLYENDDCTFIIDKDKIMKYYKQNCEGKKKCSLVLREYMNSKSDMSSYFTAIANKKEE